MCSGFSKVPNAGIVKAGESDFVSSLGCHLEESAKKIEMKIVRLCISYNCYVTIQFSYVMLIENVSIKDVVHEFVVELLGRRLINQLD